MSKSKNRSPVPQNVYVTGIPQLIYAAGIHDLTFNQVILVQIAADSVRDGNRPFSMTDEIVRDICLTLGLRFKKMDINELQNLEFNENDVVDCQIIYRLRKKPNALKCKILAAQHEYVNLKRPRLLGAPSQSWKKRIGFIINLVVPNKMWRIYTLTPNPPAGILREIHLDPIWVQKFRTQINRNLATLEKYKFLAQDSKRNALFILPIPPHWGGGVEVQKDFFELIQEKVLNLDLEIIIIKNHPSDPTNYKEMLDKFEIDLGVETINLNSDLMRIMPLEIIVESFKEYSFIGTESTVYLTLAEFVSEPTVIIDCIRQTPRKLQEYQSGELRSLYKNSVVLI